MGYRLEVKCVDHPELSFYGTKLYGYLEESCIECKLLKSAQYLLSLGKVEDEDEYWGYGADHETRLTAEETRTFLELYAEDMNSYGRGWASCNGWHTFEQERPFDWGWYKETIEKIFDSSGDKIISWS